MSLLYEPEATSFICGCGSAALGHPWFNSFFADRVDKILQSSYGEHSSLSIFQAMKMQPREPAAFWLFLWAILWLAMGFWAIVGPLFVLFGTLSFYVDLGAIGINLQFNDGPLQTPEQKLSFIALGAVLGAVGIGFFWLRSRGYLQDWPREERPAGLTPEAEQAARARFQPDRPQSDTDAIRPAGDEVREKGD
jgi:hypothetical protein